MPKPLFQDNGSGMHVHQSLWKGGEPLFFDEKGYAGLSDMARWYIGGLLKHAPSMLRVLEPDDELVQAAGARLRGAGEPRVLAAQPLGVGAHPAVLEEPEGEAARVPLPRPVVQPVPRVLGDADGRPRRHPEPHRAADAGRPDLYDLPPEELAKVPQVPGSLDEALDALEADHEFLLAGDVFTPDVIETWIDVQARATRSTRCGCARTRGSSTSTTTSSSGAALSTRRLTDWVVGGLRCLSTIELKGWPMTTDALPRVFAALADPTRRDMVARLSEGDAAVSQLAEPYPMTLQAVYKHLRVLEDAGLVSRPPGPQPRSVHLEVQVFDLMDNWIERYRGRVEQRYRRLDDVLAAMKESDMNRITETVIEADPKLPVIRMTRDFAATPSNSSARTPITALFAQWVGPDAMVTRIERWDVSTGGSWRYVSARDLPKSPYMLLCRRQ